MPKSPRSSSFPRYAGWMHSPSSSDVSSTPSTGSSFYSSSCSTPGYQPYAMPLPINDPRDPHAQSFGPSSYSRPSPSSSTFSNTSEPAASSAWTDHANYILPSNRMNLPPLTRPDAGDFDAAFTPEEAISVLGPSSPAAYSLRNPSPPSLSYMSTRQRRPSTSGNYDLAHQYERGVPSHSYNPSNYSTGARYMPSLPSPTFTLDPSPPSMGPYSHRSLSTPPLPSNYQASPLLAYSRPPSPFLNAASALAASTAAMSLTNTPSTTPNRTPPRVDSYSSMSPFSPGPNSLASLQLGGLGYSEFRSMSSTPMRSMTSLGGASSVHLNLDYRNLPMFQSPPLPQISGKRPRVEKACVGQIYVLRFWLTFVRPTGQLSKSE